MIASHCVTLITSCCIASSCTFTPQHCVLNVELWSQLHHHKTTTATAASAGLHIVASVNEKLICEVQRATPASQLFSYFLTTATCSRPVPIANRHSNQASMATSGSKLIASDRRFVTWATTYLQAFSFTLMPHTIKITANKQRELVKTPMSFSLCTNTPLLEAEQLIMLFTHAIYYLQHGIMVGSTLCREQLSYSSIWSSELYIALRCNARTMPYCEPAFRLGDTKC